MKDNFRVNVVMTKNLVLVVLDVHTKFGVGQNFRFRDMISPFEFL